MNRRKFLNLSAAALAAGPLMLPSVPAQAALGDYKALVCVFLFGGNDGWNLLVPRSGAEYDAYASSRRNMAIAQEALLPINPATSDGRDYGLHPALTGIRDLFEGGEAALTVNVGPLIEPVTKTQYREKSVRLPPQLFSHNDQQSQWHTLKGVGSPVTGWAGRLNDVLQNQTVAQAIPSGSSLFGTTRFLIGEQSQPYVMGPQGPISFAGFDTSGIRLERSRAFQSIVEAGSSNLYAQAFADVQQRALDNVNLINAALESGPVLDTTFQADILSQQLRTVAQLIAVRDELQMERQVFFVGLGGFDTHDAQVELQPALFATLNNAVAAFYDATVELGVSDQVTTFTQSDFGRTLTSNGDGTDHAWGSVQLMVGGSVVGRELYGDYPILEIDGELDVRGGRLIPTTSADQYAATLASWFGASSDELPTITPQILNFPVQNLGFMV